MDLSKAFPELVLELETLPDVVLDGELVILDEQGKPMFERLQQRARMTRLPVRRAGASKEAAAVFAFDLLYLEGRDLRDLSLVERKAKLHRVLAPGDRVRSVQHVIEEGEALYQAIVDAELEGVVAKNGASPYRAGRTRNWLKVKTPVFKAIEAVRLEHVRR